MKPTIIAIKVVNTFKLWHEEANRIAWEKYIITSSRSHSKWLTRHSYPENI